MATEIIYLELVDIRAIVELFRAHRTEAPYLEDIPPFETCDIGKLSSCLAQTALEVFGTPLYPSLPEKAAWLLYGIIKNHPFINGNKRIAVYAYLAFVNKNVSELALSDNELKYLVVLATKIAKSDPEEKEHML